MKLLKNKIFILIVVLMLAFSCICMGTYAWYADQSTELNEFAGKRIEIKVRENFESVTNMISGDVIEKEAMVQNVGEAPVLLRVSLKEILALYEWNVDTGNLYLSGLGDPPAELADALDYKTWEQGKMMPAIYYHDGKYKQFNTQHEDFKGSSTYRSTALIERDFWPPYLQTYDPQTDPGEDLFHIMKTVFANTVDPMAPFAPDSNELVGIGFSMGAFDGRNADIANAILYLEPGNVSDSLVGPPDWYYDSITGYFYYTKILWPSEVTSPIIKNIGVSNFLQNQHKDMDYMLKVEAEGIFPREGVLLAQWGIDDTNPLHALLYPLTTYTYAAS